MDGKKLHELPVDESLLNDGRLGLEKNRRKQNCAQ